MRVLTLRNDGFVRHCELLEQKARAFAPDLVIGVATGGVHVARNMFHGTPHAVIRAQRRSTSEKQKATLLFRIIRHLPVSVRDLMRITEARLLQKQKSGKKESAPLTIGNELMAGIAAAQRVLVVDDAVDSGRTLKKVLDAVRSVPGRRMIASAAITVTTSKPEIAPDFFIYNNHTLLRFPWSMDMTPEKN